jgi:spore germination protein YaaH
MFRRPYLLVLVFFTSSMLHAQRFETLFYMVDREESFQSFRANIKQIDIVGPQVYHMDEHGTLWGSLDQRVLELAKKHKVKVMPLIVNPGFDQPMFSKLLHNPAAQERAVEAMVRVCRENKLYGLQFDFENIHISDKDLFTAFYRKAADALHKNGFAISIAVVPRTSDEPGPTSFHKWIFEYWRGVYDYKALAEIGDFLSFMTYEQHTHRTTPGPVAGIPWMEKALVFVLRDVPPEKISLGIPFFSNYWHPYARGDETHVWGRGLDYAEAHGLAERHHAKVTWDDEEKVTIVRYNNDDLYEYIYLEDAKSFKAKLDLLHKYKLRGISVWRLGHEDPEVWNVLATERH